MGLASGRSLILLILPLLFLGMSRVEGALGLLLGGAGFFVLVSVVLTRLFLVLGARQALRD